MNNEFEQMVAELMGRVDKDKEIRILLPAALPDGTPITTQNKENEVTYNYFINYIYKTEMGYDSDVPYTAYSAWARDTYGENRSEKFWSSLEELVLNPEGDMLDNLQNLLDVGGMVPVYGEPIDGVNAIIYFIRGDRVNGYLAAGSMIPFISGGVQGVKLVKKGAKAVDAADTVIDTTRAVDKVVDVGKGTTEAGIGLYKNVKGHHIHAKAAFKGHVAYDMNKGLSISQDFMKGRGWIHADMTTKQRQLFKELSNSGRANTLEEHSRIAVEALQAGGASLDEATDLVNQSIKNLIEQGVDLPTRIPWYSR